MNPLSLKSNIKKIRLAKGVKQRSIANYLDISDMSYSRIENSNKSIDPNVIEGIASFLDVDIGVFFNDELTESVVKRYSIPTS